MATPSASALQRLAATAARIFGNVIGNGERSGRKWLERPLIGERVASYYPTSISATDPLYEDPLEKRCAPRGCDGGGGLLFPSRRSPSVAAQTKS